MFNGILFQESLQDLVKGIRANRRDEDGYIRKRIADIGEECRTADMEKKAIAVLKLTHVRFCILVRFSMHFRAFTCAARLLLPFARTVSNAFVSVCTEKLHSCK